jgi:hypothetical protein
MSWVVEPNVVGGWDVRPADGTPRRSRHASRDEAVAEARQAGGDVVVHGLRGEVLERIPATAGPAASPTAAPAARAAPAAAAARSRPSVPKTDAPTREASTSGRRPGMRLASIFALTDQTDASGRLLMEDSAPKQAIRKAEKAGVSMKTVPANYPDTPSRTGGTMNLAAYEALRRDTAEILNGFAWLAHHHADAAPEETGTPQRLYAVSYLGVSLPHVLFHRAVDPVPPHGQLPPFIASIFKASRGIFSFSVQMENDLGATKVMTAAEVVQYAEEKRSLVRPQTGRVCAAPTRLIERTLEVILTGEGADPHKSHLADLVDFPSLWRFYRLQDEFGELLSSFRVTFDNMTRHAGADVASNPNKLFKMTIPGGPAQGQTLGQFTEQTLRRANEIQAGLNGSLGRSENAKPIGLEELVRML